MGSATSTPNLVHHGRDRQAKALAVPMSDCGVTAASASFQNQNGELPLERLTTPVRLFEWSLAAQAPSAPRESRPASTWARRPSVRHLR
jgi:hypothetical protein